MSDLDKINKVVSLYIEGQRKLDFSLIKQTVHKDARMFLGGTASSKNYLEHFSSGLERLKKIDAKEYFSKTQLRVLSVDIDGTIARVKLLYYTYTGSKYIDYHSLIKLGEKWLIISKISHLID